MSYNELSEQEQLRRNSLAALRELGIEPYPAAEYPVTATAAEIAADFDPEKGNFQQVSIAGRIMGRRIMGSASFFELQDHTGRIQVYIRRDDICPEGDPTLYNTVFKKLLDIGDFVGVKGFAFITQTGELSVHCRELTVLGKSIRPLPVVKEKDGKVYDAFTDPDTRYRQRYVDLVVNPQVREVFAKRAKIIATMRRFFDERGYLEVETPILQPIPGGAAARPFITHHNTLDTDLYLRIANELYLKRLIVGGFNGVYEFAKDFRNEGMDRTHNPEFTVMEIYVTYKDYLWMMDFTEEMVEQVALAVNGTTELEIWGQQVSFRRPFRRITMTDAIREKTGFDITGKSEEELREAADKLIEQKRNGVCAGYLVDEIKDKMVGGEAAIGLVWSGDALYAMEKNEDLAYCVPEEGSNIWVDAMCIPAASENKEAAECFIDFMCRPDIARMNMDYIYYSTPIQAVVDGMSEEEAANEVLNPPQDVVDRCEFFRDMSDYMDLYETIWMEVKMAR